MTDPTPNPSPSTATQKQKPSICRQVVVRQDGKSHPATVVDVREDGSIDVQIFKADHMTHAAHGLKEVDPESDSDGWHWPARV